VKLTFKNHSNKDVSLETQKLRDFWATKGEEIENVLKEITGLSFLEDITVHLNDEYSKSYPILRLKIEDYDDMIDNLIHELIHILLTHNEVGQTDKWETIMEKYKDEPQLTKVHIVVHKIHYLLTQKLFPTRTDAIQNYSRMPEYVRSWELALNDKELDIKFTWSSRHGMHSGYGYVCTFE